MISLYLSQKQISKSFFESLMGSVCLNDAENWIHKIFQNTKAEREPGIAMRTGSMSRSASLLLFLISKYFSPKCIVEVGTHIGRSTISLACGSGALEALYTCDLGKPDFKCDWLDDEIRKNTI